MNINVSAYSHVSLKQSRDLFLKTMGRIKTKDNTLLYWLLELQHFHVILENPNVFRPWILFVYFGSSILRVLLEITLIWPSIPETTKAYFNQPVLFQMFSLPHPLTWLKHLIPLLFNVLSFLRWVNCVMCVSYTVMFLWCNFMGISYRNEEARRMEM